MSKDIVVRRLEEAGLDADRLIDVVDGEKKSIDHTRHAADAVSGDYGIYATAPDGLAILDIDDYDDIEDTSGLTALSRLPPTFEQSSPHGGTHRLYAVEPDEDGQEIAEVLDEHPEIGKENPKPTWGEVRVANQYVVGAGSQLDGCDKEGCNECATEDGGKYVVGTDREIATIGPDELVDVLLADPNYAPSEDDADDAPTMSPDVGAGVDDSADPAEVLDYALNDSRDEKLKRLWSGDYSDYNDDRSRAESALAYKLAFWLRGDKQAVERAMDGQDLPSGVSSPQLKKWPGREPGDGYRASVLEAVDKQTEYFEPSRGRNPDPSEIDYSEVDRADAILASQTSPTEPAGGLVHRNGCYGYWEEKRDESGEVVDQTFKTVTNFTIETVSYLDTYEGELMTIRIHPKHPMEESYEVQVHPTVFNEARSFKEKIVRGRTTQYSPGKYTQKALNDLRVTAGSQAAPSHTGSEYIGLHGNALNEWVTPKGTLTTDGWAEDPKHVYYEKGGDTDTASSLAEKWELEPEQGAEFDRDTVRTILEKLPWTRRPERGLPVLGWFYATALKPVIHGREGEFPLLQVSGGTETGKTSTLEMFYEAFGAGSSPFGCGDTGFTIEKKLAGSCGLPIWLDEYKPADLPSGKLKWLHRRLREVTREKTVAKGRPNLGEVTFKFRAPVVFSGEQTVTEAAVRRRTIITTFSSSSTSGEYQQAFCELTGASYTDNEGVEQYPVGEDLTEHALAYYRYILGLTAETITEIWQAAREQTADILRELEIGGLDDSEFRGLQTVTFGLTMHRRFAEEMGVDEEAIPGRSELKRALGHAANNIGPDGRRREHIDEFTELLTQAASAGYVDEGVHYRVVNSQKWGTDALAFHMPTTFGAVKRYVRDYNLQDDYSILGKNDYLDNFSDKADEDGAYPLDVNRKIRGLENGTNAVYLNTELAADHLGDGFNLGAFTDVENAETEAEDDAGDDDGGEGGLNATAIADLEAEIESSSTRNPYQTVTVQVNAWGVGPDRGPAESGIVEDTTGIVDLVDFFGCEASGKLEEGGCYCLKKVKAGTYDGALQLEIKKNTTEVIEIQPGVGYTEGPDTGANHQLNTAADGGEADLDADPDDREDTYRAAAEKAKKLLNDTKKPQSKQWVVNKLLEADRYADMVDDDAEKAAEAFALAKREGMIAETADGFVQGGK